MAMFVRGPIEAYFLIFGIRITYVFFFYLPQLSPNGSANYLPTH